MTETQQTRPHVWPGMALVGSVAVTALSYPFLGLAPYFWPSNLEIFSLWCVSVGALSFSFRSSSRRPSLLPLRLSEKSLFLLAACSAALIVGVGLATLPTASRTLDAVAKGEIERAQELATALTRFRETPPIREAQDAVLLATAERKLGEDRFKVLDRVASRGGTRASEAAAAARAERIASIRKDLDGKDAYTALACTRRWFPGWKDDAEIAPLHEAAAAALEGALNFRKVSGEAPDQRLRRLRELGALAFAASGLADTGTTLAKAAAAALAFAASEREKVPLLGNDEKVATELLGALTSKDASTAFVTFPGVDLYVAFDARHRCKGIYAVGTGSGRALSSPSWSAERILSQALGRAAKLPKPKNTTSSWSDGDVPVVARWRGETLIELRVGSASP